MSREEMELLADIIIEKIRNLQAQMDQEFFEKAAANNVFPGFVVTSESEVPPEINIDATIEALEDQLAEAIIKEDFETAANLRDQINKLRGQRPNN